MLLATFSFIKLKCLLCSSVQTNFIDFLRSGLSGWHNCAKCGLNFSIQCTDPRKDRRRLSVVGGGIVNIAAVLLSNGDIQVCVNLYPNHSISVFAKWYFWRFTLELSPSNVKHFVTVPVLTIMMSSKKR